MGKASLGVRLNLEAGWIRLVQVDNSGHHRVHEESWGTSKPSPALAEKLSAGGAEIVLGLPEESVHTRYLEFPNLKKGQWETAVRSTAMRYFPFQANRHTLAHILCPALSGERKRCGAVAFLIDQAALRNQTEWLQSRGCKVDHVEFESLAVQRWLCWEESSLKKGVFVWCLLGERSLQVGLVVDRLYYGCQTLTAPLLRLPQWQTEEAELEGVKDFVDYLAAEVAGAVTYFSHRLSGTPLLPQGLLLFGRHQADPTLQRALRQRVGLPVREIAGERLKLDQKFRVAAGLSLRNWGA